MITRGAEPHGAGFSGRSPACPPCGEARGAPPRQAGALPDFAHSIYCVVHSIQYVLYTVYYISATKVLTHFSVWSSGAAE